MSVLIIFFDSEKKSKYLEIVFFAILFEKPPSYQYMPPVLIYLISINEEYFVLLTSLSELDQILFHSTILLLSCSQNSNNEDFGR